MTIFGYFSQAEQETPEFDPGLLVLCPICLRPLTDGPRSTVSLMKRGDSRSYFFRLHTKCKADEAAVARVESSLIDAAER